LLSFFVFSFFLADCSGFNTLLHSHKQLSVDYHSLYFLLPRYLLS
jgi:hypothetical protein